MHKVRFSFLLALESNVNVSKVYRKFMRHFIINDSSVSTQVWHVLASDHTVLPATHVHQQVE